MASRYLAFHPIRNRFPIASEQRYFELKDNVSRRGLRRPIALFEGAVWDGRSRMRACEELGIVTKFRVLGRKDDPIVYLLLRNSQFGAPRSLERDAALELLHQIDAPEWRAAIKRRRSEWISRARREFRLFVGRQRPCAVCAQHVEFVHAHHRLPLGLQFELGLEEAVHDHDWLCPKHHRYVHMLISIWMTDTRDASFLDYVPDDHSTEWHQIEDVYRRGETLFRQFGGLNQNGRGADYEHCESVCPIS